MSAGKYNISIEQGVSWSKVLTLKNGAGTVINLTGYSARMQARRKIADTAASISLTSATGGGITMGTTSGTITLALTAAATALLSVGDYVYDLELVYPDTTVKRLLEGRLEVVGEVTR
jgi:hypothetical protein